MVDTNPFDAVGGQLFDKIFSGILWFGIFFVLVAVVGFLMWFFLVHKRKFDIKVKLISERSGDKNRILWDKAAILFDRKNKLKYFRLWNTKVDLPIPRFNVLQGSDTGDYLEIYRKSEDDFYFLTPSKINKTVMIRSDGRAYPIALQEHKQIDTDISFWNTKRKGQNTSMFDTEKMWMKILPYIPHIIGGVITIFVLYILMDSLPQVLGSLQEVAKELNAYRAAEVTTYG